jgi:hypothetical protein
MMVKLAGRRLAIKRLYTLRLRVLVAKKRGAAALCSLTASYTSMMVKLAGSNIEPKRINSLCLRVLVAKKRGAAALCSLTASYTSMMVKLAGRHLAIKRLIYFVPLCLSGKKTSCLCGPKKSLRLRGKKTNYA